MPTCSVCSENLLPEAKTCPMCGTSVTTSTIVSEAPVLPVPDTSVTTPPPEDLIGGASASGVRQCPHCQKTYGPDFVDEYCECGAELQAASGDAESGASDGIGLDAPVIVVTEVPTVAAGTARPTVGTVCLVVYSADRAPLHYHVLNSDVTLIGRSDPVRGDFPDLDLGQLFGEATAKRVSRKHALVLRSRESGQFTIRPLAKNTGTQIERELATELLDLPLVDGMRIILGGAVRLKFEVIK